MTARARGGRQPLPPPPPHCPLNFTRVFTWAQYFMGHLMPGHVLSLTAGAVAYESKCALKISFSSRDATDKELARARTSYGISYVASTYLISERSLVFALLRSISLFLTFRLFLSVLAFPLPSPMEPMSGLYSLAAMRCQQNSPVSSNGRGAAGSRSINDGILYARLSYRENPISSPVRKHSPSRCLW